MNYSNVLAVTLLLLAGVNGREAPQLPGRSATVLKSAALSYSCTAYCNDESMTAPECYGALVYTCEADGNDILDICIGTYTQNTTSGVEHNYCKGLYYSTTTKKGEKEPSESMQCAGDLDLYFATGSDSPVVQYACDGYEADEQVASSEPETCTGTCDGESMTSPVCKGKFLWSCVPTNDESWSYDFSCDGVFSGSEAKGSCAGTKSFVLKGEGYTYTQTCSVAYGYEFTKEADAEACQGAYTAVTDIQPQARIIV
eukprot:TRINITY_DN10257_c0_g2_i7.p1 TRINITY_DN10257_c0_g2~~TRINITY_DN10257_c0_g2_i7.p1  ORF type:complete len:273 (-),score=14.38 TRINITY_DN10257_c0_g2_i7:230-997(-)